MDDSEFDIELAQLFNEERKKEYYYLVSVEQERQAIISAFYDHYMSVAEFRDVTTVDDFLQNLTAENTELLEQPADEDDDFLSPLATELNELIQKDIESYDVLLNGEMQVSGEGLYMMSPDEEGGSDVEILENGATMVGDIQWYSVAPMIPYELFLQTQRGDSFEQPSSDAIASEMPGVWLLMNNVVVTDSNGVTTNEVDQALIPLSYPSLRFHRVIRQEEAVTMDVQEVETEQVPVQEHFKSDFMREICNDIENDLNHNEYEGEEAHAVRAQHQNELAIYMGVVDHEAPLRLRAFSATLLDGNETELNDETVRYVDSVIMNIGGTWRVVHAFETTATDGTINIAHVLPEYIVSLRPEDQ